MFIRINYSERIGVIILSAVLKRRMMLADQAKSLFISKFGSCFIFTGSITNSSWKHLSRASYAFAWGKV